MKLIPLNEFVSREEKLLQLFKTHWEAVGRANRRLPMRLTIDDWVMEYHDFVAENHSDDPSEDCS